MTDIFFSYSSEDRERIAPIVAKLEAYGYKVWWDTELKAGETYDEVIEERVEASACVIVAWSKTSRKSRWVRSEANEGLDRDALVPILIEDVKPPIAFRLVQAENFTAWDGSTDDTCWKRLILQVDALVAASKGRTANSRIDVERLQKESPLANQSFSEDLAAPSPAAVASLSPPQTKKSSIRSFIYSGLAALGVALVVKLGLFAAGAKHNYESNALVIASTLAILIAALFSIADRDLSTRTKSLALRWLMPVPNGTRVSVAEAFYHLFAAAFGQKHPSWKCIRRSALASVWYFIIFVFLSIIAYANIASPDFLDTALQLVLDFWRFFKISPFIFLFVPTFIIGINIIGDYISLYETRILLRLISRHPRFTFFVSIFDAIASILIYLISILLTTAIFAIPVFLIVEVGSGEETYSHVGMINYIKDSISNTYDSMVAVTKDFVSGNDETKETMFAIILPPLLTTLLTTAWLWVVAIFGPMGRRLLWSDKNRFSALGKFLEAEQHPFRALGRVIAMIILAVGILIQGLMIVLINSGA